MLKQHLMMNDLNFYNLSERKQLLRCMTELSKTRILKTSLSSHTSSKEGQLVLVRHENPQKFESKWFGPYQVVQKMLLGTYRLHDPNGRELAALVHGNRLIDATVRTADELKELWASPRGKDILCKRNKQVEILPSYPENTEILDQYLQKDGDEDEAVVMPEIMKKSLKRKRKPEIFDEIIVERER